MSSSHSSRALGARNPLLCVAISAALTACAMGPNFHSPAPPATQHYTQGEQPQATVDAPGTAGAVQTFVSDRDIPGDWWTLFQSEPLDGLVRESLRDSPNIASAKAASTCHPRWRVWSTQSLGSTTALRLYPTSAPRRPRQGAFSECPQERRPCRST